MATKITIWAQVLTGNNPPEFNVDAWIDALRAAYREIAADCYPSADVDVQIDVQRACGYCRPVQAWFDGNDIPAGWDTFKLLIAHAQSELWNARADEFYTE